MAVTIEKRPVGVVLDTCVSATINQDYNSVYATVNKTAHGLVDGDYVYIQSNVENYNGFWAVEVTNANEFILIDNPYVEWIVNADITYCPQLATHGWSCVHLPIVYKLGNTRWPVNSVDTARTISSISDDNGYVNLNLSGSLGTFEDLSFIKISSSPDSDFDGVYQIIDKLSTSDVTINLAFSSVTASGITGATIQLYYSNYNIVVKVYAGINSTHTWADQKPYELAATLELIPDTDNKVTFSINEILKSYVETENNLLLATLPNNINAWSQFYIQVAEQYDTSDGYTVTTFEGGIASDQSAFEGYAVNAMLPFKNIHSGYLSEYVMTNSAAKFLTLFSIPVLFSCGDDTPDCYSDVSFILPKGYSSVSFIEKYYSSGSLASTTTTILTQNDEGCYRVPLSEANCDYDRVDVYLESADEEFDVLFNQMAQEATGSIDWIEDVVLNYSQVSLASGQSSEKIGYGYPFYSGIVYNITQGFAVTSAGTGTRTVYVRFYTTFSGGLYSGLLHEYSEVFSTTTGNKTINFEFALQQNANYIVWQFVRTGGSGTFTVVINGTTGTLINGGIISETQQYKIQCGCSNQEIRISWLNYLGGFEYWNFTGETEHTVDITNSGETKQNIFPNWPKSYGEHADTIRKQTFRESANRKFVFSQYLTQDEADAIAFIKSSPLVQIVNSRQDRRTVLVDTDSFTKYKDGDKTYSISFNIIYTDDIPSQRV